MELVAGIRFDPSVVWEFLFDDVILRGARETIWIAVIAQFIGIFLGIVFAATCPERVRTLSVVSSPLFVSDKDNQSTTYGYSSRLEALQAIGHPTDKIELLILGGTWSAYRRSYQTWFVQRCLDAMNGFDSADLAQHRNRVAGHQVDGLDVNGKDALEGFLVDIEHGAVDLGHAGIVDKDVDGPEGRQRLVHQMGEVAGVLGAQPS